MTVPIFSTVTDWYCPNCGATDQTREPRAHVRYHTCPKLRFLSAPMYPKDVAAKVTANEREDYVGTDDVFLAPDGRPVMNIVTTRDEGQDCMVFAPTAHGGITE